MSESTQRPDCDSKTLNIPAPSTSKYDTPFGRAHTLEQYLALPKSERYVRGFYKTPLGMTMGSFLNDDDDSNEWAKFHKWTKKTHPIQHFFREYLAGKIGYMGFCLREWKYNIKCRFFTRQKWLIRQLPRHHSDVRNLMVVSLHAMVVHFVEDERALEQVLWEASGDGAAQFAVELRECYNWIKVKRVALQTQMDQALTDATHNRAAKTYDERYGAYNALEAEFEKTETEMLEWIVKNRLYFWV